MQSCLSYWKRGCLHLTHLWSKHHVANWNAWFWSSLDLNPNVIQFTNVHAPIRTILMIGGICLDKGAHPPLHKQWSFTTRRHLGPLHTRDWEPVTITLQALSLVEKAEPVQVRFTRGTNGECECKMDVKSLHGVLHGIKWMMFHGHLDYFQKPSLGGRPKTKSGDRSTPNAHNRWFIIFYHVWGSTWIEIHWNSIWLRAPITYDFTLHDFRGVLGRPLDTFFWVLTISRSRLLARVWHGHYFCFSFTTKWGTLFWGIQNERI